MNQQYKIVRKAVWALAVVLTFGLDAALAATRVDKNVSGATPVELLTFSTPAGTVPDNHQIVVNLLVNDAASDLEFQVEDGAPAAPPPVPPASFFHGPVKFSTGASFPGNQALADDNNANVFITRARDLTPTLLPVNQPDMASGHRIIKLRIEFQNGYMYPARTWSVRAKPTAAALRFSGFWSEGDGADTTAVENKLTADNGRPIIDLRSMNGAPINSIDFGRLQTNIANNLGYIIYFRVANVGTAALTSGPPPAVAAPFSISSTDYNWSAPIKPAAVSGLKSDAGVVNFFSFKFRPTAIGVVGANVQFAGVWLDPLTGTTEPVGPVPLALSGEGIATDMIALVDTSGSMCFGFNGGTTQADCVAQGAGRMWQAKQSIWVAYETYRALTEGGDNRFGLYTFPDWTMTDTAWFNAGSPATANAWRALNLTGAHQANVQSDVSQATTGIQPVWHATPMAEGLRLAHNDLPGGNRLKYIVLFSDGDHNLDSTVAPKTPDEWLPVLLGDSTRVLPIAYGAPGAPGMSGTNHALLQQFACTQVPGITVAQCKESPRGEYFPVTDASTVDAAGIKKVFERVTKTFMGLNEVEDPRGTLPALGKGSAQVCIEDTAQTMTVMLDWEQNQRGAIGLTLAGPHGQSLTPTSAGVTFFESDTSAMYVVKPEHMVGGMGGGTWTLNFTGTTRTELGYNYSVYTQGPDKVTTNLSTAGLTTGGPFAVELDLRQVFATRSGPPQNFEVYMEVTSPGRSHGTYLSDSNFDLRYLFSGVEQRVVPQELYGGRATLAARKQYALENFLNRRFVQVWGNNRVVFADDGMDGDRVAGDHIYTARTAPLSVDGRYQFHLVVQGVWNSGCLKRDIRIDRYVPVALPPQVIDGGTVVTTPVVTVLFPEVVGTALNTPAAPGTVRQSVVFTPQDEFGNKLGPGHAAEIGILFEGAEPLGSVIDDLDGRYEQVFAYPEGTDPKITVSVGGTMASMALSSRPGYVPPPPLLPSWWLWVLIAVVAVVIVILALRRRATGP